MRRTPLTAGPEGAFVYAIAPERCTGCARCALECNRHGTKSIFLVVRPDLCLGCNQCSIASACPSQAVVRVPSYPVDDYRGEYAIDRAEGLVAGPPANDHT